MILRKTDWITCVRLSHVSIAKQLVPSYEDVQAQLNAAVATGNIWLVSKMLQTCDGFPDMDIAAKADQFVMLKMLDSMEKAGSCVCQSTNKMAVYAATNCNLAMLDWLLLNRLEVDGKGVLEAAAEVGCILLVIWILDQAAKFRIVTCTMGKLSKPCARLWSVDMWHCSCHCGVFQLATWSLYWGHSARQHAAWNPAVPVFLLWQEARQTPSQWVKDIEFWLERIDNALMRGDAETRQTVLDIMEKLTGTGFQNHLDTPAAGSLFLTQQLAMVMWAYCNSYPPVWQIIRKR